MELKRLVVELANFLQVVKFQDYCPNGLQVEGRGEVCKIVTGVTASQALIDHAIAVGADALLVHHGYFWKGERAEIVGYKKQRLQALLKNDISLLAYHLPLDAHPLVGNNVQLAQVLAWPITRYADEKNMCPIAELERPITLSLLGEQVALALGRKPLVLGNPEKMIHSVAWCTGAAQSSIQLAVDQGVDAFLSGEVSEQTHHIVQETGVAYLAAGHHATERYGVQALGQWLAQHFAIEHQYVELDNPI